MKFEQLTPQEKTHIKKAVKELMAGQKVKMNINPNEFDYKYQKGALLTQGRLVNMDDRQIKCVVIRNVKEKLVLVKS